jgi:obg-like ATPase 1
MPPKKKDDKNEPPPLIGRLGTSLKVCFSSAFQGNLYFCSFQVGIVGIPNVGKSTFFNVLTKSSAPAENFPFCTIDPNEARVIVPDERFDWLVKHYEPDRFCEIYFTHYFCAYFQQSTSISNRCRHCRPRERRQ